MRTTAASLALALTFCAFGCIDEDGAAPSDENSATVAETKAKEEVQEAVEAVKTLAGEKAEQFQETMRTKLASLDQRIDELRRKAEQAAVAGRKELKVQTQKLVEKRQALQKKLDDLGSATEEAWAEMKAGLDAAYGELEKAVEEAATQFSDAEKEESTAREENRGKE